MEIDTSVGKKAAKKGGRKENPSVRKSRTKTFKVNASKSEKGGPPPSKMAPAPASKKSGNKGGTKIIITTRSQAAESKSAPVENTTVPMEM
mmetsp:Transcript_22082/g.32864  ORF Transcript_22082/g.32864 Transcript_22082/m.32864 type:complete len:91 (+) Transcript_22082:253-525(+)